MIGMFILTYLPVLDFGVLLVIGAGATWYVRRITLPALGRIHLLDARLTLLEGQYRRQLEQE